MPGGCWSLVWIPAIAGHGSRNRSSTILEAKEMSTNLKEQLPQRLHHNTRVVKDHERTRQLDQDVIGMPLVATRAEIRHFPDFPERIISDRHTFSRLPDRGPRAFLALPQP